MKKSKQVVALISCTVLTLAIALTGCGSPAADNSQASGTQTKAPGATSETEKATITHFTIGNEDKLWIKEVMPGFEKAHPNIKMEFLAVPYENFDTKLKTMLASGAPPDVTTHYGAGGFIEYYNKNMIMDLTPILQETKYNPVEEGVREDLLNIYKINGKQYGIPVSAYVSMLFYNKDMFDKEKLAYPATDYEDKNWTFDKMVEMAQKLTKRTGKLETSQFGLKFDEWSDRDMRPLYFGAKIYSDDTWTNGGFPSECYYNSPEAVKAFQRYSDLQYKDKVAPTQEEVKAFGAGGDPFSSGKVAMYTAGAWVLSSADKLPFKLGVAAIPAGGNEKVRDVLYVDPLMIIKGCKAPKAAMEWIKYLTSKEIQETAIEKAANPPANKLAYDKYFSSVKGVDPQDLRKVVDGGIKYGTEAYNHLVSNSSQVIEIITNEMGPTENSGDPAEKYTKVVQDKINDLLKKSKK